MRTFERTLLAGVVALTIASPAAAQFSNVYFFGDSLSDSGNFKSALPAGTGLFTTNPGPVSSQVLAAHFGFDAIPSTQGGNTYGYGGARVTDLPGVVSPPLSPAAVVPVATQVSQYLAKGPASATALYSIQGGGNDFFYQFALLGAGATTPAQVQAALGAAAGNLARQAALLKAAGAGNLMVWGVPDVGTTLDGVATGQGPTLTALSNFFNSTLFSTLDALGVQGIRLNTALLQNETLRNPAAYGIKNVTAIACTTAPTVTIALCNASTLAAPDAATTYYWANGSHPTTLGHEILADFAISYIEGPQQIAALGAAPFAAEDANYRALDGRMWSTLGTPRTQKKFQAWAAYDYGSNDLGASNASANTNTIVVGADTNLSDKLLFGGSFGYTDNKGDFGGAGGGYTLRQPVGTMYVGYGEGPWYLGATLGAGALDYSDVDRNIPLGAGVRTESGQTRGYEYTGRLLGGYWLAWKDLLHGPYARVTYTRAIVKAYSETGSDSTALMYGEQDRTQLLWSLGWQASGRIGAVRPFGRVTWEYDSRDQTPIVSASSVTLGGSYAIAAPKPDNNYVLFNVGASADFGGVTGFLSGSGTAARGDGNYWAVTVGVRMPI